MTLHTPASVRRTRRCCPSCSYQQSCKANAAVAHKKASHGTVAFSGRHGLEHSGTLLKESQHLPWHTVTPPSRSSGSLSPCCWTFASAPLAESSLPSAKPSSAPSAQSDLSSCSPSTSANPSAGSSIVSREGATTLPHGPPRWLLHLPLLLLWSWFVALPSEEAAAAWTTSGARQSATLRFFRSEPCGDMAPLPWPYMLTASTGVVGRRAATSRLHALQRVSARQGLAGPQVQRTLEPRTLLLQLGWQLKLKLSTALRGPSRAARNRLVWHARWSLCADGHAVTTVWLFLCLVEPDSGLAPPIGTHLSLRNPSPLLTPTIRPNLTVSDWTTRRDHLLRELHSNTATEIRLSGSSYSRYSLRRVESSSSTGTNAWALYCNAMWERLAGQPLCLYTRLRAAT
eukprot:scaffold3697_cov390-Prasinococcus_capsulatus_cf.AAC.9